MSDFTKVLTHGRRLKAAVKDLSVAELEEVQVKLAKVIDDRRDEEAELQKEKAEMAKKMAEIKQAMDDAGIDISDFIEQEVGSIGGSKPTRKRAPKPPKYAIIDANGERVTWTGQGRMPNVFKAALAKGDSLSKYLIK